MIRLELVAALAVVLLVIVAALYRLHRGANAYDLAQLIAEPDGTRLSLSRVGQAAALLVSSWGFVWLTLADRMTEWYYTGYMLAWAGTAIATRLVGQHPPRSPEG